MKNLRNLLKSNWTKYFIVSAGLGFVLGVVSSNYKGRNDALNELGSFDNMESAHKFANEIINNYKNRDLFGKMLIYEEYSIAKEFNNVEAKK